MRALLDKLHAKIGDLLWYSLLIFIAQRSGDFIQAFIGLWLVPRYVGLEELGAVIPLQLLAGLFTVPLTILSTVFAKYVNTYATRNEFGKVKSFIHDVLVASVGLFILCIGAAYLVVPQFYARLNVASGSLTVLILLSGFFGNISGLFGSALQGLKKFTTMTVQSIIAAPVRLVTLLVAMPFRALSGYILGQTTPSAACGALAAWTIHKDLKDIPRDTSWRKDIPQILRYLVPVALYTAFSALFTSVITTVYRQRLPEVESAAYYLLTRFTEIAGYIGLSMIVILTPLASEAHEKGKEDKRILRQTLVGTALCTLLLAALFPLFGRRLLSLSSLWTVYLDYAYLFPALTLCSGMSVFITAILSYEMACRRFGAAALALTVTGLWTVFIVGATGIGFFQGILPDAFIGLVRSWHIDSLKNLTIGTLIMNALQMVLIFFARGRRKLKEVASGT